MVVVLLIVVALGAFAAVAYFSYQARQKRIAELTGLGMRLGLQYSPTDSERLVDLPFALFGRGDGRKIQDVLRGERDGCTVHVFDYEYYDETRSTDGNGMSHSSRSYTHFTCGMLTLRFAAPHLVLGQENLLTRLGRHVGIRDIELESNEFNQRYRVKCDDQRFAFSLIDARMMEWLLQFGHAVQTLEICGPWALVAVDRLSPSEWPTVLDFLQQLRAHVPNVVYTTYPPR
jgi:hypothetical protein